MQGIDITEPLTKVKYDEERSSTIYRCPICGGEVIVKDETFYGRCDTCLATLISYLPAPHQVNFHKSKAKFRLNIGGFGSGKTTMGACEVSIHALTTPNGKTLITAQTLQQVKEAVLPELEKFIPPWFLAKKPVLNPLPKYTLNNGHEIVVFTSDNEEKLRSLNLTAFWIIEASGVDYSIFTQLQTRLRNKAAVIKDSDGYEIDHKFMGIVESNPEDTWIRDEFLLKSYKIFASPSVDTAAFDKIKVQVPEKAFHSFLSSSVDNKYLHKTFISDTCVGKSDRWIRKYIYCYLETKEGVVYPEFVNHIVDPFPIPNNWLRQMSFDKGWTDQTCLISSAIDPKTGVIYVYDDYYVNQQPITYHARRIKELISDVEMYKPIQADPSVRNKSDRDGVSYQDYFYQVSGIWLAEANNSISDGIERVRDYMYRGKLKFFSSCVDLKREADNYVWKKDKDKFTGDKPIDKMNHLMDSLRYLCMSMPLEPRDIYVNHIEGRTKDTILDRLKPNTDITDFMNEMGDGYGGLYGFGTFDIN